MSGHEPERSSRLRDVDSAWDIDAEQELGRLMAARASLPPGPPPRRRSRIAAAALAIALGVLLVSGLVWVRRGGSAPQTATTSSSTASTPSPSGAVSVTKVAPLDFSGLGGLAAAEDAYASLWVGVVTDVGGTEVVRADPVTGGVEHTFPVKGWSPNEWGGNGIVIGGGYVWIPGREDGHATIVRIDPTTDRADVLHPSAETIAYLTFGSDGMLWANVGLGAGKAIAQIDPHTGEITRSWPYTADWAHEICEAHGAVWVHEASTSKSRGVHGGWLSQVVPGTAPRVETGATFARPVCSADSVWAPVYGDQKAMNLANGIARIDPTTGAVTDSWSTPPIGYDITLDGEGGVWFIAAGSEDLERLDPSTGNVDATEAVTGTPIFISSSADRVWVGTHEGRLIRFDITRR